MKPSIPKGTRDFSPTDMVKRNFIFKTIQVVFELNAFQQIETPAMEHLSTLEGKYGEEGDKLLFRILNSGEKLNLNNSGLKISDLTEKGLRYDLTVPFARYVVQHQNEITFPFKRYQIQSVWRADRPQKGRYREFYQCDADVIGSDSLLNEVELIGMIQEIFSRLKTGVVVKINNRKILSGIAEVIGEIDRITDITVSLDKLDKIGVDGVNKELKEKGISEKAIEMLKPVINFSGNSHEKISLLKNLLSASETGKKGISEMEYLLSTFSELQKHNNNYPSPELDITLARGLNYYTGAIFEVKANDVQIGSICGGGRYDNLTGIFGLPDVSGVGISFGIDRIYDVMDELNLFDRFGLEASSTKILFAHFGEAEQKYCLPLLAMVRAAGINAELYPDVTKKINKQFDYANKMKIPFVVVIGEEEMKSGELSLKNMLDGTQEKSGIEKIIKKLTS